MKVIIRVTTIAFLVSCSTSCDKKDPVDNELRYELTKALDCTIISGECRLVVAGNKSFVLDSDSTRNCSNASTPVSFSIDEPRDRVTLSWTDTIGLGPGDFGYPINFIHIQDDQVVEQWPLMIQHEGAAGRQHFWEFSFTLAGGGGTHIITKTQDIRGVWSARPVPIGTGRTGDVTFDLAKTQDHYGVCSGPS